MKRTLLLIATLSILFSGCSKHNEYELATTNVMVFDSESKRILNNKTILINADTVAAVVNNDQKIIAKEVIEGNGKLVSPGFIDTQ